MLTGEQVLTMIEAGFTADEIRPFATADTIPPEIPAEDPNPAEDPATDPEPAEDPPAQPEQVNRSEFEELKNTIAELTKTIQMNNILTASKNTPEKTLTPDEAADAAIKAFFNA